MTTADRHPFPTLVDDSVTYGGRYVPEVLIPALDELAEAWTRLRDDAGFRDELGTLSRDFVGPPDSDHHERRGSPPSSATTSG